MPDLSNTFQRFCDLQNRRQFLTNAGAGLGAIAASTLAQTEAGAAPLHQGVVLRVREPSG